ncbi:hypothetical protein ACFE04_017377 [Oxalis oulophora]
MLSSISINLLVTFAFLLQIVISDPLGSFCLEGGFIAGDAYSKNLAKVFSSLKTEAPRSGGFSTASFGKKDKKSYGLALCRGDVSESECKTCVTNATVAIAQRCKYETSAIIWYDNCELKYSSHDFFGGIDTQYKLSMASVDYVKNINPYIFNNKTKLLLSKLAEKAVARKKFYATGKRKLDKSNNTLYGLTQCTRDITSEDCKKCLDQIIGELMYCCNARQGGRVLSASCNFRYELYPFVNA